jgi:hypothetical protein
MTSPRPTPRSSRATAAPRLPTMPRGDEVAAFSTYLDAQKAVDTLSDEGFPVQYVTIVGTDLRMVERVTGRLTYSRVAAAGLASGAWFGLFVGLVLSLFGGQGSMPVLAAIGIGAGFGLLFSVLSFSLTRGKRDFTSSSQIVAASYSVLCEGERAGEAARILREHHVQGVGHRSTSPAPVASTTPRVSAAAAPDGTGEKVPPARDVPPAGEPRYGVRTTDGLPPSGTNSPRRGEAFDGNPSDGQPDQR